MTGKPGSDDDLLVFDAVEPTVEELRGRSTGPGGRQLGPGRGAGAVAAVLVLLVVGIIVGNASLASDPSGSPSPSASISAGPSAKNSAVTTDPADLSACSPPRQGQFPSVTLGIEGSRRQVTGLFGFGSGYGHQTQAPGWQVPTAAEGLVIREGDRFVLGTSRGVCFRHVVVDYAVTERVPRSNLAPLFNAPVSPSANSVVVNGLPDGDWTLRVTAQFDTLGTVSDDVVTVSFFRILAGAGPFLTDPPIVPTARPAFITPAVPCGPGQPTPDMNVNLVVGGQATTPGAKVDGELLPEVHASLGDPILMITDGEVCATRWQVDLTDAKGGNVTTIDQFHDSADDPAYAAQNRWTISTYGNQRLDATLQFPGGLMIVRSWQIVIDGFVAPDLYLVGPNGGSFQASAGCGLFIHLANGYKAGDDCGSIGYQPGAAALHVAPFEVIHLDLRGWQITSWSASCGRVTIVDGIETYESPGGCGLGSGSSEGGGPLPDPLPDPPAFLLPRGDTVVQIGIGAIDSHGNQFNVSYFAHVIAR